MYTYLGNGVIIVRNAHSGDKGYVQAGDVFIRTGGGDEYAVRRADVLENGAPLPDDYVYFDGPQPVDAAPRPTSPNPPNPNPSAMPMSTKPGLDAQGRPFPGDKK